MTVPFRLDSQGKDNLRYRRDMQRLGKIIAGLPSSPSAGASGDIQLSNGAGGFTAGPLISAIAPLTTKGDLYTYSTMATRLPVGTDGQILSAHSAATTGLQWSPAPTPTPSAGTAGQVQLSDGSGNFIVGTVPVTVDITTGAVYGAGGFRMLTVVPANYNFFYGPSGNFTATGTFNVGVGATLNNLTSGSQNFGFGFNALQYVTSGSFNVAVGDAALTNMTTPDGNIGIGFSPLYQNISGAYNVGIGFAAGYGTGLTNMSYCTFIGTNATSTANSITNSSAIGNGAQVTVSNEIVLGNSFVTQVIANGNLTTPILNTTTAATAATGTFTGTMTGVQPFIGAAFKLVLIQLSGFTSAGGGVYTFPAAYTTAPTVADPLAGATITTTTTNVTVVGTSLSGAILLIGA